MRPKPSGQSKAPAERVVKVIRRATRRHFSTESKIRIVPDGLRGEAGALKKYVADLALENRLLKKTMSADGGDNT